MESDDDQRYWLREVNAAREEYHNSIYLYIRSLWEVIIGSRQREEDEPPYLSARGSGGSTSGGEWDSFTEINEAVTQVKVKGRKKVTGLPGESAAPKRYLRGRLASRDEARKSSSRHLIESPSQYRNNTSKPAFRPAQRHPTIPALTDETSFFPSSPQNWKSPVLQSDSMMNRGRRVVDRQQPISPLRLLWEDARSSVRVSYSRRRRNHTKKMVFSPLKHLSVPIAENGKESKGGDMMARGEIKSHPYIVGDTETNNTDNDGGNGDGDANVGKPNNDEENEKLEGINLSVSLLIVEMVRERALLRFCVRHLRWNVCRWKRLRVESQWRYQYYRERRVFGAWRAAACRSRTCTSHVISVWSAYCARRRRNRQCIHPFVMQLTNRRLARKIIELRRLVPLLWWWRTRLAHRLRLREMEHMATGFYRGRDPQRPPTYRTFPFPSALSEDLKEEDSNQNVYPDSGGFGSHIALPSAETQESFQMKECFHRWKARAELALCKKLATWAYRSRLLRLVCKRLKYHFARMVPVLYQKSPCVRMTQTPSRNDHNHPTSPRPLHLEDLQGSDEISAVASVLDDKLRPMLPHAPCMEESVEVAHQRVRSGGHANTFHGRTSCMNPRGPPGRHDLVTNDSPSPSAHGSEEDGAVAHAPKTLLCPIPFLDAAPEREPGSSVTRHKMNCAISILMHHRRRQIFEKWRYQVVCRQADRFYLLGLRRRILEHWLNRLGLRCRRRKILEEAWGRWMSCLQQRREIQLAEGLHKIRVLRFVFLQWRCHFKAQHGRSTSIKRACLEQWRIAFFERHRLIDFFSKKRSACFSWWRFRVDQRQKRLSCTLLSTSIRETVLLLCCLRRWQLRKKMVERINMKTKILSDLRKERVVSSCFHMWKKRCCRCCSREHNLTAEQRGVVSREFILKKS